MTTPPQDTTASIVRDVAKRAKIASRQLGITTSASRNTALVHFAKILEAESESILAANARDLAAATAPDAEECIPSAMLPRLMLDAGKLASMIRSIRTVAEFPDPIGRIIERTPLDEGLELRKVAVPIGVIAAIFEARPDAVTQIASLAIKSGNAVVLKCGREVTYTTRALMQCLHKAISAYTDLPVDAVSMVEGRSSVDVLLTLEDDIDLVIPRGSNAMVRWVQRHTRIPVLGHAGGVCHVFVDRAADIKMAVDIVVDGKVQYPSACNATETVLIHQDIASAVLPSLLATLHALNVEVRGCARTRALSPSSTVIAATEEDWGQEYGTLIIACRVVDDIGQAVAHITKYGSGHTEAIVTNDAVAADQFQREVDAAGVYHNASTRFADGFRYGLGAEIGVSTEKIHARGPVGLEGLTTYKYLLDGAGHIVRSYVGTHARLFLHEVEHPRE